MKERITRFRHWKVSKVTSGTADAIVIVVVKANRKEKTDEVTTYAIYSHRSDRFHCIPFEPGSKDEA
jgi:ABC-type molybdate transport system substrate-binding protein